MKKDLVTIADLTSEEIGLLLRVSERLKGAVERREEHRWLRGRTMAMIFEKPSLRTRVTFETGMNQLGGSAIYLGPEDIKLGERESVPDIGKNLSLWVDVVIARTFSHKSIVDLAESAKVPVINGLSDLYHPCQVLADLFTLRELRGGLDAIKGLHVAFVGDGNNMVHSWMMAAARVGFDFTLVCPVGYEPDDNVVDLAKSLSSSTITVTHDITAGTKGVDVLYTDVWASMGQEEEAEERKRAFAHYQVNGDILANAAKDAIVMHCLPAHRGEEISAEVLDGPQSVVLQQAENRLHLQKALVAWLLGAREAQS
jgi:ornithine carbamoyltransferase